MSAQPTQHSPRAPAAAVSGVPGALALTIIGLFMLLGGCSSVPVIGGDSGTDIDTHFATANTTRAGIIHSAAAQLGMPYKRAADGPQAFGDNGLVQYAYARNSIQLPLQPHGLLGAGAPITLAQAQPGDLVFYQTQVAGGAASLRVGLYLNSHEMLYASAQAGQVVIQPIDKPYWRERLLGVVRVLP